MKINSKFLLAVINLICIATLLLWFSQNISLQEVITHLGTIPKTSLITVLGLSIAILAIYGLRMSALLGTRFTPALATIVLGFGLNGILPLRLGDVAKMVYVKQLFGISTARVAAATAVEKLLDIGAVLIIGFSVLQFVSFGRIHSGIYALAAFLFVAVSGLLIAGWLLGSRRSSEQRIYVWLNSVLAGVRNHFKGQQRLISTFYTAAIWAVTILTTYVMFASIYDGFGLSDAFLLTLVLVLAIAIPGAPAGLGIVEAGIVGYLHEVVGVDAAHAIAAALAFHLATVIPQVFGAVGILIWGVLRGRFRWGRVSVAEKQRR